MTVLGRGMQPFKLAFTTFSVNIGAPTKPSLFYMSDTRYNIN